MNEERLIGLAVTLATGCVLLIRFLVKKFSKVEPDEKDSAKRLARLREERERERERRLHEHFKDYRGFRDSITESVKGLEWKASEMEKDVAELKERIEHADRSNVEHREQLLERLTKLEGAARTLAQIALDARHEVALFGGKLP